jgi:hypothetical protein
VEPRFKASGVGQLSCGLNLKQATFQEAWAPVMGLHLFGELVKSTPYTCPVSRTF